MIKFTKQGYILSALLLVVLLIRLVTWNKTQNEMMFEINYSGIKAIKSNNLDSSVLNSKWFNGTPNLVVESGNNLYISKNFGVDWEIKKELKKFLNTDRHTGVYIDSNYPSERAYVYRLCNEYHQVYYTEDAGENWGIWDFDSVIKSTVEKYFLNIDPNMIEAWAEHVSSSSFNRNYLIASINFQLNDYSAQETLEYISTDFGKNWELLSPIEDLTFDESKNKILSCNFDVEGSERFNSNRVICEYEETEFYDESNFPYSLVKIYESEDLGDSWTRCEFFENLSYYHVSKSKDYTLAYDPLKNSGDSASVDNYVSKDSGKTFKKINISMALPDYSQDYEFRTSSAEVFDDILILKAHNSGMKNGSKSQPSKYLAPITFISDTTGLKFYSFDEITGEDYQNVMHSVFSVPGFKNTLMTEFIEIVEVEPEKLNDDATKNTSKYPRMERFVQATKISFDNGYSWSNIKINSLDDSLKDSITLACDPSNQGECTFKSFYRHATLGFLTHSAGIPPDKRGIQSLNGMVSETDISKSDDKNDYVTFISRDGGHSFDARLNFSSIIAMGDHGNILVAIPKSDDYRYSENFGVYYSLDQGKTWDKYQLNIEFFPINIKPVVKDGSGFHFLVTGKVYQQGSFNLFSSANIKYINIILDFSDIHGGVQCDEEKDMEIWELNNGECVDGLKHSYKRRKQFSKCSVNKLYEKSIHETSVCECTEKDFECAPEFYRDFSTGKCVLDSNLLAELSEQKCKNSKDKKISIPTKILKSNNVCKNPENVNIDMQELTCDRLSL